MASYPIMDKANNKETGPANSKSNREANRLAIKRGMKFLIPKTRYKASSIIPKATVP